jgi:REP element-mobilizing transposase RayT
MPHYNPDLHHRRSIRLKGYDYSQSGLYFITVCVQNRQCLFGEIADREMHLNATGEIVKEQWLHLSTKYPNIDLHAFVIMPNHFHGIVQIVTPFVVPTVETDVAHPSDNDVPTVGAGFARPDECTRPDNDTMVNGVDDKGAGVDNNGADDNNGAGVDDNRAGRPRPYVPTLGNVIAYFKYQTTKQIDLPVKLWQRNYYEHIIRSPQDYARIDEYIAKNPENWTDDCFYNP